MSEKNEKTPSIKRESFQLKEVKLGNSGLKMKYRNSYFVENEAQSDNIQISKSLHRHPDIDGLFAQLRVHFAIINGMLSEEYAVSDIRDLSEEKRIKMNDVICTIFPTGVTFIGSEDNRGYVFTVTREVFPGRKIGMATPVIYAHDKDYKFCEQLAELCDSIEDEVYEYVALNKSAQLELPFGGYADGDAGDMEDDDEDDGENISETA